MDFNSDKPNPAKQTMLGGFFWFFFWGGGGVLFLLQADKTRTLE